MMSKYYDITVAIKDDMVVYQGDPDVLIEDFSSVKKGDPCNILKLQISSHTGTHIDAPYHFFMSGQTVDQIPPESLIGKARVILIRNEKIITKDIIKKLDLSGVERLLFKTDHSYLRDRYSRFRSNYIHLDIEAADYLASQGIKMVGIDSFSVENFESKDFLCHKVLLGAGVLILEMLNLREVEPGDYELICLPLKISKGDGSPVRAFLRSL